MNAVQTQAISMLLRVVGQVIANNSGDKAKVRRIADYIGLGATVIETGVDSLRALRDMTKKVEQFVQENRPPTDDEFHELQGRSDQAHRRIQNAARADREANQTPEETPPGQEGEKPLDEGTINDVAPYQPVRGSDPGERDGLGMSGEPVEIPDVNPATQGTVTRREP